jgi:hypothetical protein
MPFTLAHPAIVIPIQRKWPRWFSASGLIIGSMAPDFEYFIRFQAQGGNGHTLLGFLIFNLPLVILAALLIEYVVKEPFIMSLPGSIRRYFIRFLIPHPKVRSIRLVVIFIFSAFFGMFTHVLWDAFTHENGFFVNKIHLLSQYIPFLGFKLPLYKLLQHGSTILGLGFMFAYFLIMSRKANKNLPKANRIKQTIYWASVVLVALSVLIFRALYTLDSINLDYYGIYIVTLISGLIIGVLWVSIIYQILRVYPQEKKRVS